MYEAFPRSDYYGDSVALLSKFTDSLGNPSLLCFNCWRDKLSGMTSTFCCILQLRCIKFLLSLLYDCKESDTV